MKSKIRQLCVSNNGIKVFYDSIDSHTATHFEDTPNLKELAKEIISSLNLEGDVVAKEIDLHRIIGKSDVVEIDETDELVYAMRRNREDQGRVPFTKSRDTIPSSLVSIYLAKKDDSNYELLSAWIGELDSPPFPGMENATYASIPYWSKRAFVWGSQEIIPGTEVTECPW